jgi:hypothetical protein
VNEHENREIFIKELEKSKTLLEEKKLALPAHSMLPHQWARIEELEEKISLLEKKLNLFEGQTFSN